MTEEYSLPPGWVWTTLGTITTINPKPDTSEMPEDTPVSFVPMAAVEAGTGYIDTSIQRPLRKVRRGYTAFQENDVLFAKITPCMENGKAAVAHSLVSGIGFGSTEFHVLRSLEDIHPKFIYYYISQQSFRRLARQRMTGTAGQLRVPASYLSEVSFPLAPLAEQQRIVEAIEERFSHIDAGVALLKAARRKLRLYRASVLKAAVEGKLTEQWRAAHPDIEPAPQLLRRILAERRARWEEEQRARGRDPRKLRYVEPAAPDVSRLPPLPDGWCWATVDQVSYSVQYGTSAKASSNIRGIPVLRMGNIKEGELDVRNLKYLPEDHEEFPALLLNKNDLLFNRTNSPELVGKSAVYRGIPAPCSYASYLIRVGVVAGCIPDYLCFYLNSVYGRMWVASVVSQQVGQANVNGSKLRALSFPFPPLEEQEQIVALVEEQLSIISNVEATIEHGLRRAERQRQSVLRQAFTGQLVPQDERDEPASVLLERIRGAMNRAATHEEGRERGQSGERRGRGQKKPGQPPRPAPARPPEPIAPPGVDASNTVQPELWEGIETG